MKPSEMADALRDYAQLSSCTVGQALVLNRAADELDSYPIPTHPELTCNGCCWLNRNDTSHCLFCARLAGQPDNYQTGSEKSEND